MAGILAFSEKDDTLLELISKGKEIKGGAKLAALLLSKATQERAKQCFSYGADTVYLATQDMPAGADAGAYANVIAETAENDGFDLILVGSTRSGKVIAGMLAQRLGAGCITDAIGIKEENGNLVADRYSLGGNTVASLVINTPKKVIAVMPRALQLGASVDVSGETITLSLTLAAATSNLVQRQEKQGESTPIEEAETLVCIGRGLAAQKDIPIIEEFARALKAEIGCTRPLTHDWQWFPESREVGLSGKKCKPSLCFSVGISGQIQHTVGIRTAKIIVAINKDKNAPIFKVVDYGIVGDLYDVVPRLTKKIQALST